MKSTISGFHQDQLGDWVADLACGHTRHMRHDPPWQNREWITTPEGRTRFIGSVVACKVCAESGQEGHMTENEAARKREQQRIAQAVRAACLQAAIEAYEYAQIKGLCQEGAWDLAVDAVKTLDLDKVLEGLPG